MASTIKLKNGSGAPLASDLVQGEPAFDLTNKRLYTENASGTVIEVGTNPAAEITANGGIALPDNQKATFGASDDLQIYHDGSHSYVRDAGTGDLYLGTNGTKLWLGNIGTGEAYAEFNDNGAVSLRYDAVTKLATTTTGIDVTGTVTADGLTIENSSFPTLNVNNASGTRVQLEYDTNNATANLRTTVTAPLVFETNSTERMRIDSSGNVGIGASSPNYTLQVGSGTADTRSVFNPNSAFAVGVANSTGFAGWIGGSGVTDTMVFSSSGGTERMRIDSSGNLLVGKTTTDFGVVGTIVESGGNLGVTRTSAAALNVNRLSTDGDIAKFYKDGTTVGSIGSASGVTTYFDGGALRSGVQFNSTGIDPRLSGALADNSADLGQASYRWKNLYLSGGVYLGGTGAANLLDDYEEGTWTPVYEPASGAFGTITYDVSNNYYTKVGRICTVTCVLRTDSFDVGTGTGAVIVSGLPFAAQAFVTGGIGYASSFSGDFPSGFTVASGATSAFLYYRTTANGVTSSLNVTDLQTGAVGNANYIMLTIIYQTT